MCQPGPSGRTVLAGRPGLPTFYRRVQYHNVGRNFRSVPPHHGFLFSMCRLSSCLRRNLSCTDWTESHHCSWPQLFGCLLQHLGKRWELLREAAIRQYQRQTHLAKFSINLYSVCRPSLASGCPIDIITMAVGSPPPLPPSLPPSLLLPTDQTLERAGGRTRGEGGQGGREGPPIRDDSIVGREPWARREL